MSILDKIKQRHGIPTGKNITQQSVEGYSPIQRTNYVSLGNTVELTTEIVHGLIRGNSGMSDRIGDQKLLKRDIADLVGARLYTKLQDSIATHKEPKQ